MAAAQLSRHHPHLHIHQQRIQMPQIQRQPTRTHLRMSKCLVHMFLRLLEPLWENDQ